MAQARERIIDIGRRHESRVWRNISKNKANGALVFLGKRQGSERNASTKSKKTTLASGEPRSVGNSETRSVRTGRERDRPFAPQYDATDLGVRIEVGHRIGYGAPHVAADRIPPRGAVEHHAADRPVALYAQSSSHR
jgi:hypothetical protein